MKTASIISTVLISNTKNLRNLNLYLYQSKWHCKYYQQNELKQMLWKETCLCYSGCQPCYQKARKMHLKFLEIFKIKKEEYNF